MWGTLNILQTKEMLLKATNLRKLETSSSWLLVLKCSASIPFSIDKTRNLSEFSSKNIRASSSIMNSNKSKGATSFSILRFFWEECSNQSLNFSILKYSLSPSNVRPKNKKTAGPVLSNPWSVFERLKGLTFVSTRLRSTSSSWRKTGMDLTARCTFNRLRNTTES